MENVLKVSNNLKKNQYHLAILSLSLCNVVKSKKNKQINKIEKSPCEDERADYDGSWSKLVTSKAIPECDQYGEYYPVRCKNGTT